MGRKKSKDAALDNLPASIRLTAKKKYEVLIIKELDNGLYGECRQDYDGLNQIVLASKQFKNKKDVLITFIHELIHAISFEYLPDKQQLTESQVMKLERGVYNVLKLNGWLNI